MNSLRLYKRNWRRKNAGTTSASLARSETWKGRRMEMIALRLLTGATDMNKDGLNKPFDLLWNGKKIDVKSCNLFKRKRKRGKKVKECSGWWVFNTRNDVDYYLCACMIENMPERYYLIPANATQSGISIGYYKSKFNKYLMRVDI